MSLRCSLTGHDWGEKQVEVERDERDGEIALTEREFRVCERCGDRRVIAENTEVRALDEGVGEEDDTTSTFAPSDEFETEETEDAAIIEGTLETSTPSSDETEVETDPEGRFEDEPDESEDESDVSEGDGVKDRVREATGTEVTKASASDETEDDADYVCPDCGFTASGGSYRTGDICPECGGYIEEA
jgi:rubrerythrin